MNLDLVTWLKGYSKSVLLPDQAKYLQSGYMNTSDDLSSEAECRQLSDINIYAV
jgi:hypothetical protein